MNSILSAFPDGTRTLRACDSCRTKKIKCDGVKPICEGCKYSKIPCTYLKPHRKETTKNQESLQPVVDLIPSSSSSADSADKRTKRAPFQSPDQLFVRPRGHPAFNLVSLRDLFKRCRFGDVDSYEGYPILSAGARSWIYSLTGEEVNFESFFFPSTSATGGQISPLQPPNPYDITLPTKSEIREMAVMYFTSESHKVFPLFSRDMVFMTIEQMYKCLDAHKCVSSARSCILAMLAFFARCDEIHPLLLGTHTETFSKAALQLLPDILFEGLGLEAFGSITLLCANQSTFGDVEILEHLVGIATRMIFSFNGHLKPSSVSEIPAMPGIQITPDIQAHIRKLFWVIYSLDKDLCFRTLRPPIINDDDCDMDIGPTPHITLPDSTINPEVENTAFYPADVRLAILKGKIYRDLYSAKALRSSDTQLLKIIRELDEDLDVWKSELPVLYRPQRSQISEISIHVTQNARLLLLHLEYYQSLNMIHRASTRCLAWDENTGQRIAAVRSSVDLCLEASRSTIYYLQSSKQLPRAESFWLSSHYPMSSLITIFCNLLQHPTHSRAWEDYALLSAAPQALSQNVPQGLLSEDANHVKFVYSIFNELSRLAKCALDKSNH